MANSIASTKNYTALLDEVYKRAACSTCLNSPHRMARAERNLTLGQLSQVSGVSKAMLSDIEKGGSNPTINTIWKIANGLNVPYTRLMEKLSKRPPSSANRTQPPRRARATTIGSIATSRAHP